MSEKSGEFRALIAQMFRERQRRPHLTVSLLRRHWADILGAELARKTYPARIKGNTLWINTVDSAWAFQLQFLKHELLESVQVFMDTREIGELRFKQGDLHDSEEGPAPATAEPEAAGAANDRQAVPGESAEAARAAPVAANGEAAPGESTREAEQPGPAAIADPSLRESFGKWQRVNKRRKPANQQPPPPRGGNG